MRRAEFVFCTGYTGGTAIIDKRLAAQYSRCSTRDLAEKGLFKSALAGALWDENKEDMEFILSKFNEKSPVTNPSVEALKRALGVSEVFRSINRTTYL